MSGGVRLVRTQIQLTEAQAAELRRLAAEQGTSVAELVREAVEALLANRTKPTRHELKQRALAAVGRYRSGLSDVAVQHDRYLNEVPRE